MLGGGARARLASGLPRASGWRLGVSLGAAATLATPRPKIAVGGKSCGARRASSQIPPADCSPSPPREPLEQFSQSTELFPREFINQAAAGLAERGFFHQGDFLAPGLARTLRSEAEKLHAEGAFAPNMSARFDGDTGELVQYAKKNVLCFEFGNSGDPEAEFARAPGLLLLLYLAVHQLGPLMNERFPALRLGRDVGHQLAVSKGGGSAFPLHTDNVDPDESKRERPADFRKLTCLFYLNPGWRSDNGGQIRLYPLGTTGEDPADDARARLFEPATGILLFWSDLLYHDTLPCLSELPDDWRYTLTLWLVTDDPQQMHKLPEAATEVLSDPLR
jgi:2OG-Fe(II) oxygenase superfamily